MIHAKMLRACVLLAVCIGTVVAGDSDACQAEDTCTVAEDILRSQAKGDSLAQKNMGFAKTSALVDEEAPVVRVLTDAVVEERENSRAKLGIEADLAAKVKVRAWQTEEDCATNADKAFEEAFTSANLDKEFTENEKIEFRTLDGFPWKPWSSF